MNFTHLGLLIWEKQFPDLHRASWGGPKSQEKLLPLPCAPGWVWSNPKPSSLLLLIFPQGWAQGFRCHQWLYLNQRVVWGQVLGYSPIQGLFQEGAVVPAVGHGSQPSPVPVP